MSNEFNARINENVNKVMKHLAMIADHTTKEFGISFAQRSLIGQDLLDAMGACGDILFVTGLAADREAILQEVKARKAPEVPTPKAKPNAKKKSRKA